MNEQPTHNPSDHKPAAVVSESAYLQNQVDDASAAISNAVAALKADLAGGVDPRAWAHAHPWVAVGAAAVAGFAAASALIPSKEEQALKKLERIERALRPEPDPIPPKHAAANAPPHKSLGSRLFSEAFAALKPVLSSALTAYAATAGANGRHHGNGHATGDPYYQEESDPDKA